MGYDETTCFWCGKHIEGKATCSLGTDTLQTRRNFCNNECIVAFKDFFDYRGSSEFGKKPVLPYKGRN